MNALTARQEICLEFIRGYIRDHGVPPAQREIGAHMGIRSTNGVNDHLRALERKGFITRRDVLARSIRVRGDLVLFEPRLSEVSTAVSKLSREEQFRIVDDVLLRFGIEKVLRTA